jgi:hypothetical protein
VYNDICIWFIMGMIQNRKTIILLYSLFLSYNIFLLLLTVLFSPDYMVVWMILFDFEVSRFGCK